MFNKILIANRGEIACRVIATARKLGVRTVAVFSDADRNALHVSMADESVHIGPSPSRESYLAIDKIISAAKQTGAEAIHPGYGFLSENAAFCRACKDNDIVFIGPPVAAIEAMGSKSAAKQIMEQAGVPLVPGYHGENQDRHIIKQAADRMGYPVLLKAAAGGGGKGMRQVWQESEFDEALLAAKREAMNAFGDDTMLVEKYLTRPRHVEIQVFFDQRGQGVHLFERDCSVQRRHQKVLEEAPAPGMTEELRQAMGEAALRAAKAIDYEGAGTVEFLLDTDSNFYFMEMNTRLQVEHPVTEKISGQDLVEWQLRVAAGEPLPLNQEELCIEGHAFEARVYAEDPDNDFLPVTGTLSFLQTPEASNHVRVDTGVLQGDEISVYYDPMIAKLIVWDRDRDSALRRLHKALSEYRISGLTTNLDFLYNLSSSAPFRDAQLDTEFIDKHHSVIFHDTDTAIEKELPLAALYLVLAQRQNANLLALASNDPNSPWHSTNAWRMNEPHVHHLNLVLHEQSYPVEVEQINKLNNVRFNIRCLNHSYHCQGTLIPDDGLKPTSQPIANHGIIRSGQRLLANIDGHQQKVTVSQHDRRYSLYTQESAVSFRLAEADLGDLDEADSGGGLIAPMNGTIVEHLVATGEPVEKGSAVLVMEAMKMEHTLRAPAQGTVEEFYYQVGDLVDGGVELARFNPS